MANSMPVFDFYSTLSGLGDTLQANQKLAREQKLRDSFKDGIPKAADGSIDFNAIGQIASQNGADLGTTLTIAKLAEDQRKNREELKASSEFRQGLGGIFGGAPPNAQPTPAPLAPSTQPVQPMASNPTSARAEVLPSPKVWGDKEAEEAGLYPKTASFGDALSGKNVPPPAIMQSTSEGQPQQPGNFTTQLGGKNNNSVSPVSGGEPVAAKPGFTGIGAQHIPALFSAMANPRLPSGDRDLAGKLLTRALDDAKEPDKIRTLNALKEQSGYKGSILQLEKELRAAGKTEVNIDQKGETEEAKAAGKAAGERRAAMFSAANNATSGLAQLTRIGTLLNQVQQGKLEPGRMTISAWAKSLGVNDDFATKLGLDPKKVGDAQAVQSLVNELVIGKLGPGGFPSNNFSDSDRQFLTDIFPKLGNDPRANKILIEAARRIHADNIQRAQDYQTWKEDPANKGRGFEDFEQSRYRKVSQMDRFGDLRKEAENILSSGGAAASAPSGNVGGIPWSIQ